MQNKVHDFNALIEAAQDSISPVKFGDKLYLVPNLFGRILDGSMVFVSGVGKSDVTHPTNLLCSLSPTYHLYCPYLFKMLPPFLNDETILLFKATIQATLLADYIAPLVRGMYVTDNPEHVTYCDWYWATNAEQRLKKRNLSLQSYDACDYLAKERPLFVADMCEFLYRKPMMDLLFPNSHWIHVIRNGLDVVNVRCRCNWDTDLYYHFQAAPTTDWITKKENVLMPVYVSEQAREHWNGWNQQTRAAHIWRIQTENLKSKEMFPISNNSILKFEDLCDRPFEIAKYFEDRFGFLNWTETTDLVIEKFNRELDYKVERKANKITIEDIQEPERKLFVETMEMLGYL